MPHLSPMNWIMALTLITIIMLLYTTCTWWNHMSKFPQYKSTTLTSKTKWHWNL